MMLASLRYASLWFLVALLPLQWIVLAEPLGLRLKPAHIALPIIVVALLSVPGRGALLAQFLRSHKMFLAIVHLYLILTLCSAFWASDPATAVREAVMFAAHFAAFVATAIIISSLRRQQLASIMTTAIPVGLAAFLALAVLAFANVGRSLFTSYLAAVASGSATRLQFGIYTVIFGGDTTTSLRNTLVGAFVIYAILMLGVRTPRHRGVRWLCGTLATLLVLLSVSRSNILALFIACTVAAALSAVVTNRRIHRRQLSLFAFLGVAASVLLLIGDDYLVGMIQALSSRFASVSPDDNRLAMYRVALEQIASRPFLGYGAGYEIAFAGLTLGRDIRVHNFFLASWLELGVSGLMLSIAFYGYIIGLCVGKAKSVRASPTAAAIATPWLVVLPVLPLFRSLVSGDGGQFTFIEWFALSVFFGLFESGEVRGGTAGEPMSARQSSLLGARRGERLGALPG